MAIEFKETSEVGGAEEVIAGILGIRKNSDEEVETNFDTPERER